MTNFLAVCEELVAALDPKVVLTDGYGPITSLVLRTRATFAHSNKSMTEDLPEYGTLAYCASKFVDYPPMTDQFPDATKMVLSPAAQAVLDSMRRSYDHEPTRRVIASEMLWVLVKHLPIQELRKGVPDEFEQGMAQGQHLSRAWLEMVSEELRNA
jgi:hypothetical protein